MSNLVAKNTDFTSDQVALIKRTLLDTDKVKYTDDELTLFVQQAKRTGLDPFTRQIYASKRQDKMTVQATIDGLRLIAERTGKYQGQTKAEWCAADGAWKDVWLSKQAPAAARIGVFKEGFREALYATAIFDEYAQRDFNGKLGFMWAKMPALMIAKVAEALALRKAFPNDLSGIYSTEEMQQAEPADNSSGGATSSEPKDVGPKPAAPTTSGANDKNKNPGEHVVTFGKYKGMQIQEMLPNEIEGYIQYLEAGSAKANKPLSGGPLAFVENAKQYLSEQAEITNPDDMGPQLDEAVPF